MSQYFSRGIKCMQSFTADILVGFLFEESRTNVLSVCVPSHRWVNTERSCIVSVCVPAHRWVGTVDNLVGFCRLCPPFKRCTGLKCGSKCSAQDGALKFEVERTIWEHDFFVILSRRLKRSKFGRAGSPKNVSPRSTRCKFRMPGHLKMYFDVQLYNFGGKTLQIVGFLPHRSFLQGWDVAQSVQHETAHENIRPSGRFGKWLCSSFF